MTVRTSAQLALRGIAIGLIAVLVASFAPLYAHADDPLILETGHVDAFNVSVKDGKLMLDLKEDVTGSHVLHDPSTVELHVKSAAFTDIPDEVPGHPKAFWLPMTQDPNLLWPGWDTLGITGSGFGDSVDLVFSDVSGPGEMHLVSQGSFGGLEPVLEGGSTLLKSGAVRRQSFPAHTHAHWIFTKPGIYTIDVKAVGTKGGVKVESNQQTYTVTVGDDFRGKAYAPVPKPTPTPTPTATVNPTPKPEPQEPIQVLDHGHVDAFNISAKQGKLSLDLKEDVTGNHVRHSPSNVELHVKSAAHTTSIPEGWPGAPEGYALPMTQDPKLLWPGWDTLGTMGGGVDKSIRLQFTDVRGPGAIHLFGQSTFGGVKALLDAGQFTLATGSSLTVAEPAHVHANWVFAQHGVYKVTAQAEGTANGNAVKSAAVTYTFTVGDEFRGKGNESESGKPSSSEPADGPMKPGSKVSSGDEKNPGGEQSEKKEQMRTLSECTVHTTVREATPDEVNDALAGNPGKVASVGKVGGSVTIPANTHVHPNWVFSAPGTYALTIRQTTKSKSGQILSGTATLRFVVSQGGGGATSGHFDFGPVVKDGKLIPMLKDDRKSPPKWVSASSQTFVVGNAAKATAPAGIEFVAQKGQAVWMIASAQVSGVPWLGTNTMHESLLAATTGETKFTLVTATGPGNVAVFTSGNFGKVVDQVWFTKSSGAVFAKQDPGSIKAAIAKRTEQSAQVGEVFLKDGKHMIKEGKWQYSNGQPCTPKRGIPHTGVSESSQSATWPIAVLILLSMTVILVRRSRS